MVMPEELSQLHYVEMIIKETLRLFSVPATGRKITEDLRVNDKFKIPAGVDVWLSIYAIHHDAELWERPGEFYPEHFTSAKEKSRPKGAFIPFLSGPRICPGNLYAMRSIKFLVANTLLRYKFSTDEKPPDDMRNMDYKLVFLMWPMSGFNLRIEQR
ncbi:cytochrome P450 4X1 [Bemisia tabaci]|uniref:cytochrome P450 4X1 n=1 Tax=Bemisia tabaci TaxID=7038 RepID=UPI003B28CEA3